jgi:hypothetical protein
MYKSQLLYVLGNYEKANEMMKETLNHQVYFSFHYISSEVVFYRSLILTQLYNSVTQEEQENYLEILHQNMDKLEKWSKHCPKNFLHKFLLVSAEVSRLKVYFCRIHN